MSNETAFRTYLKAAHGALEDGKPQEGERIAKAVSALVRAERDVGEFATALLAVSESGGFSGGCA